MTTDVFDNMEKCYDRDVFETVDDAVTLRVIHWEQGVRFLYEKSRGMRFINEAPEQNMFCDDCAGWTTT